jgi:hypothetical protein
MSSRFYIPDKIIVGFKANEHVSTGKLGAPIYKDARDHIIREKTWRQLINDEAVPKKVFVGYETYEDGKPNYNKSIYKDLPGFPLQEIDNTPIKGFILNKTKDKVKWENSPTSCYLYDPRGFEINISLNNLLYIHQLTKGDFQNIDFVYSWYGEGFVLLPCISEEYIESVEFQNVKSMKFSLKDLKPGCTFLTKELNTVIYMGKYDFVEVNKYVNSAVGSRRICTSKEHMFCVKTVKENIFIPLKSTHLAKISSDKPVANFNELSEELNNTGKVLALDRIDLVTVTIDDLLQKERDEISNKREGSFYINNTTKEQFIGFVTQPKGNGKYESFKLFQVRRFNGNINGGLGIALTYNILGYKMKPSYQEYTINENDIVIKSTKTLKELNEISFDRTGAYNPPLLTEDQLNTLNLTKVKLKFKNSNKLKVI